MEKRVEGLKGSLVILRINGEGDVFGRVVSPRKIIDDVEVMLFRRFVILVDSLVRISVSKGLGGKVG